MTTRTEYPRPIREIEHTWLTLSDGCRLAARIWLPEDAEADPVPAVLEYLPYRKGDGTAIRDARASPTSRATATRRCGSTCAAPATPTGSSRTSTREQEHADGLEVIAWLRDSRGAPARSACGASPGAASTRCSSRRSARRG